MGQSAGHKRLGQHGDGGLASLDLAQSLGGFAAVLDGDIVVGVDAVLGQDIAQDILRRGALAGGDEGLALEISDAVYGLAIFDDVQHAQRVDAGNLNGTVGLLVQGSS